MPDLTDAERKTLAWKTLPCDKTRGGCGQTPNHRCVTASGAKTSPHKVRMDDLDDYLIEQKIAGLEAAISAAEDAREDALQDVADLQRQVADLGEQLRTARAGAALVPGLQQRVADLLAEQLELRARIDELEHPAPGPRPMLLGAGGGNLERPDVDINAPYYGAGDVDKAITRAKSDHAKGILPWLSFKLPVSWTDALLGKADTWFDGLMVKLAVLGFEVWVTFHHEPEGDGDTKLWRQMQDRLSRRVPGGIAGPIKFWLVVTGYHQEYTTAAANQWATLFPVGAPIYGIAYDGPYQKYGFVWDKPPDGGPSVKTTQFESGWTDGPLFVKKLAARAAGFGVKAAIREWGYSDEAFAKDPAWLDEVLKAGEDAGLLAMVYFDSLLNSSKSWWLGPAASAKRAHFYAALDEARGGA